MFCQAKLRPLAWWFRHEAGHLHMGSAQGNAKKKKKGCGLTCSSYHPGDCTPARPASNGPQGPGQSASVPNPGSRQTDTTEDRPFLGEQANDYYGKSSHHLSPSKIIHNFWPYSDTVHVITVTHLFLFYSWKLVSPNLPHQFLSSLTPLNCLLSGNHQFVLCTCELLFLSSFFSFFGFDI